jgi:hypothetical protein
MAPAKAELESSLAKKSCSNKRIEPRSEAIRTD